MSPPNWTHDVSIYFNTRTLPESLPFPSLKGAPIAIVLPLLLKLTEFPYLSFAASPLISAPS